MKKQWMMIALIFFGIACGDDSGDKSAECASDNECKGERICSSGACVTPGQTPPANNQTANNQTANNQPPPMTGPADFGQQCDTANPQCEVACLEIEGAQFGYCSRTCASDDQCPESGFICDSVNNATSKYCVQGQRVDPKQVGEACTDSAECASGLCYGGPSDTVGYCTNECQDFTDCPDFWSCDEIEGAAVTICVQ